MAPLGNRFGLHLSAIGHTAIQTGQAYPPGEHPSGRAFSWEKGRIIHALQLVAIREGAGQIEWMREQQRVRPGTAFILKPGDWHRYRPDRQVGWTEDWFEIRGELVDHWLAKGLFEERFYKLEDPGRFFMQFDAMHEAVHTTGMIPEGSLESRACGLVAESQTGRAPAQWRAEHIDPNRERFGTGHESPTKLQHE